jgi:rfaE bifunctional protein kinase chain/domain
MNAERFRSIVSRYRDLSIAIVGDFCLDRYLEIDPSRAEVSIETGLEVHNVVHVRSQPGAAGTILNNLVALGVGRIFAVGFCGDDGEGFELERALRSMPGVDTSHFLRSPLRRTFVYCKPLLIEPGKPPRELNRLDSKNWTPTPQTLRETMADRIRSIAPSIDALILMDQVDLPESGVVTSEVARAAYSAAEANPRLVTLADSRRGLHDYPPIGFKMNAAELGRLTGGTASKDADEVKDRVTALARSNGKPVFVTLAEHGIVGAVPGKPAEHVPAHPIRGEIDIVGAGDSVTANLAAALAAGAELSEAMQLAMAAASLVIHQLGTTGTATPDQIQALLRLRS